MTLLISYLPYKDIDKTKWDRCVEKAGNRLMYGFSFYLDNMAANWDGLILGDYEAVMPLTWKKKLQVKYLYQPAFMQQAGIFSQEPLSTEITNAFLEEAARQFKFAEITLNYANPVGDDLRFSQAQRINFVVPLKSYDEIFNNYDPAFTKSLRRIKKFNIRYEMSDDYNSIIRLYKELYQARLPSFKEVDFDNMASVCKRLAGDRRAITRLAFSSDNTLVAAVVLLKDDNRLYNVISCITEKGKKLEANYFLYDNVLREFAGQGLDLDLEGSEVRGVANFYRKLGPVIQPYPFVKYNELHPLLRVFKK